MSCSNNVPKENVGAVAVAVGWGWLLPNVNGAVEVAGAELATLLPNILGYIEEKYIILLFRIQTQWHTGFAVVVVDEPNENGVVLATVAVAGVEPNEND